MTGPSSRERELAARLREAQEALRARDEFLAIAAHELRSPINALGLQLAALERMALSSGADARLVDQVQRARRHTQRYVRRASVLLDISRLNSGQLKPAQVPVHLRAVVQSVMDMHADEAAFHGAALRARVDGDPVGLWEPHMVEEMLSNLVSNAIKYGTGTPVTLSAGMSGPDTAYFAVADGGPGIDAQQQSRIFEKFERVVANTKHRSGFGLGLWIVARMAAAHQGRIDVDTPPGGGTVFTVKLPLRPQFEFQEEMEEMEGMERE